MKRIYRILYDLIAKKLPLSNARYNFGSKKIRYFLAKRFVDSIGENVNIEKQDVFEKNGKEFLRIIITYNDNGVFTREAYIINQINDAGRQSLK